jgi:hypothetical protein
MEEKHIGFVTFILQFVTALLFDGFQALVQFIPLGGQLISSAVITPAAFTTFYIWFKLKGMNFMRPSRILTMGGSAIIEFIPVLNVLPAWSLAVVLLHLSARIKKINPLAKKEKSVLPNNSQK